MRTYFDQNRIMQGTDRRFHAADIEMEGGRLQTVPAVASRMTPLVRAGAWGWSQQRLEEEAKDAEQCGDRARLKRAKVQQWWNQQWRKEGGIYGLERLTNEERDLAERLVGPSGFDPDCFPDREGKLEDHNDAQVLAEVVARGGTMLITADTTFVDEARMGRWFNTHKEVLGLKSQRVVYNVDELFIRWSEHPGADGRFLRTVLGAYWPEDADAGTNAVREAVEEGVKRLGRGGHMPRFAVYLKNTLETRADIAELIREVRRKLPVRMRQAEKEYQEVVHGRGKGPEPGEVTKEAVAAARASRAATPSGYEW